ncbi:putative quinol monooxygenase [Aestuariivita boseongensis]|jgi:quinol monooxygenase YgiN|uniref:putative quinol monooxygenase n=1 Tax=Aestuariivita boseongensis TaxID=1470562 RepID=UPI000681E7AF|nr:antibiotic biosynthesis monooxygenase [Aestuariivita boseongensis]
MEDGMRGGFFAVNVKPEHRQSFLNTSIFEAQNVVSEEAEVFQFHIMVDMTNPNRFYFYEVFRNEAAVQNHWESEAFKNWLNTVRTMLDGDIEMIARMRSLFPTNKGFEAQKPGLLQW